MIEIRHSEAFASLTIGPATRRRPAEAVDPNAPLGAVKTQQTQVVIA
ncbi:hypothetical protein [Arthrobacter sp. ISL-95]|nr:hypothetical protein [Arthrobacter sp. ISL-95]MBT2587596.1 hypothetical protein [Arthrobacter sp. ISL-95]